VVIDHYSKWVETKVLKEKSGEEICTAITGIIKKLGCSPKKILTDCGLEFNNKKLTELLQKNNI
jgi:hypothetical protein